MFVHFLRVHKQLIVRIVNILLDVVKYEPNMQQEDSHSKRTKQIKYGTFKELKWTE